MDSNQNKLGTKPIGKLLFEMAVPAIIVLTISAMYNMVDTIVVGKGVGATAIGALTVAFPVQMFATALFQLVSNGASSVMSRRLGENDDDAVAKIVSTSTLTSVLLGTVLTVVVLLGMNSILSSFGASGQVLEMSKEYMNIVSLGFVFVAFNQIISGLKNSEGNAIASMLIMFSGILLNTILDPIFVFVFDMGIGGAAYATLISQAVSSVVAIITILNHKTKVKPTLHRKDLSLTSVKEMVLIGFPSFLRDSGYTIFSLIINNTLVLYGGVVALNSYGVVIKVMMFILMPIFGIMGGFGPIAGYNYGSKQYDRLKLVIKQSTIVTTTFLVVGWFILFFNAEQLMTLFTSETQVISIGSSALKIMIIGIPFSGLQTISASYFQAIGRVKYSMLLNISKQYGFLIPLVLILPKIFNNGITGIWMSYPIADIAATIIGVYLMRRDLKKLTSQNVVDVRDVA